MEPLEEYLRQQQQWVEAALDQFLPSLESYPPRLMDAMRYSMFAGGKRLPFDSQLSTVRRLTPRSSAACSAV